MDFRDISPQFISEMIKIYGKKMNKIILFGSVARGDQTETSDVDIAVIFQSEPQKDEYDRYLDFITQFELEHNKVISVVRIDMERYQEWKDVLPFYRNIENEGIVLWQAA